MRRVATALGLGFFACTNATIVPATAPGVALESIAVTSKSFPSGGSIPIDCTCDGKNQSPEVTWSSPPEGTKALVVTLDDVEASSGLGTRWVVMDVKPEVRALAEGVDVSTVGARLALSDGNEAVYRGPCPPRHEGHHYALRVLALDRPLALPETSDRDHVNAAMTGHVLGSGELVGTASR